jgi:hypothetical protein
VEVRDPIEITDLETLHERIDQGGVFTVTRGPFAVPTAHQPDCFHVGRIRLPQVLPVLVDAGLPDRAPHLRGTQVLALPLVKLSCAQ